MQELVHGEDIGRNHHHRPSSSIVKNSPPSIALVQ
jgi:hypothetical protein